MVVPVRPSVGWSVSFRISFPECPYCRSLKIVKMIKGVDSIIRGQYCKCYHWLTRKIGIVLNRKKKHEVNTHSIKMYINESTMYIVLTYVLAWFTCILNGLFIYNEYLCLNKYERVLWKNRFNHAWRTNWLKQWCMSIVFALSCNLFFCFKLAALSSSAV